MHLQVDSSRQEAARFKADLDARSQELSSVLRRCSGSQENVKVRMLHDQPYKRPHPPMQAQRADRH